MKLRNKKTGEVVEAESCNSYSGTIGLFFEKGRETDRAYETLDELNADWEDYEPKEPLIKDEKVRKAVQAWAEVNAVRQVVYIEASDESYCCLADKDNGCCCIKFVALIPTLKDCGEYTIAELCGEEE